MIDDYKTSEDKRWESYREANGKFPHVRLNEMYETLSRANIRTGSTVFEVGTGNGYLTFPLADKVGPAGKVVTLDTVHQNLVDIVLNNRDALQIVPIPQKDSFDFPVHSEQADSIVTLATVHHYDDRSKGTGMTGRANAFKEFHRMLKHGGQLVVADGVYGSPMQRYFDAIDTPRHCHPRGHPHDFLDKEQALALCKDLHFEDVRFEVVDTPWVFKDESEAKLFLNTLHNAQCTPDESMEVAKQYLPYKKTEAGIELGWSLSILTAKKHNFFV